MTVFSLHSGLLGGAEGPHQERWSYTLDKSPVYHRAALKEKQALTLTLTPRANSGSLSPISCMWLDCRRKLQEERTTKAHTERPLA